MSIETDDGFVYVVRGKVVHGGEVVPPGTVMPEAAGWKYIGGLVNQGKFERVTREAAKELPVYEGPADTEPDTESDPEDTGEQTDERDDAEMTQEAYDSLSVDEVEELLEAELLTVEQVEAFESARDGKDRKGIAALVELYTADDDEGETDEDETDEDETDEGDES